MVSPQRKWQIEKRKQGLCIQCGKNSEGKARCKICTKTNRKSNSKSVYKFRLKWKEEGKCMECGKIRDGNNKTYCEKHRIAHNKRNKERYLRNKQNGS